MTIVFVTFYFSESPWGSSSFDSYSESLVTRKLLTSISFIDDLKQNGGFLLADKNNVSTIIPGLYTSQVGLQGILLNAVQKSVGIDAQTFIGISRIIVALLFAITIGIILHVVLDEFGLITGFLFVIIIVSSSWLVAFSKNLYWVSFTSFLPFAIGWYAYPKFQKGRNRFSIYLLITLGLILLKSLNGYEYITNVILGATIGPLYYELKSGTRPKDLIKQIVLIGIAGIAGFAVAYLIHFSQLLLFTRDFEKSIYILTERAIVRTLGDNPYKTACDFSNPVILLLKYLNVRSVLGTRIPIIWMFSLYLLGMMPIIPYRGSKPAAITFIIFGGFFVGAGIGIDWFLGRPGIGISQLVIISIGIAMMLFGIISLLNISIPNPEKLVPMGLTTTWALVSSFTWVILARNHMACHIHLNSIVFYLPFGVTLFLYIGFWIQIIVKNVCKYFAKGI